METSTYHDDDTTPRRSRAQSRVSRGERAFIDGIGNLRTKEGRRWADLLHAFAREIDPAGFNSLGATRQQVIRRLATAALTIEVIEAKLSLGANDDLVRLSMQAVAQFNKCLYAAGLDGNKARLPVPEHYSDELALYIKAVHGASMDGDAELNAAELADDPGYLARKRRAQRAAEDDDEPAPRRRKVIQRRPLREPDDD